MPAEYLEATAFLRHRHRFHWAEALPWALGIGIYFALADSGLLALGAQILIMMLFALSLDLALGYAGILTLGHAAFFGVGAYTVGILGAHFDWSEPISGLVAAAAVAALVGLVSGLVILRTHGLTLLMLTMAIAIVLHELANERDDITGGFDGLSFTVDPLLGTFEDDLWGRTDYVYVLAVLFIAWLFMRLLVHSPFGRGLVGIRENVARMRAIGAPVRRNLVTAYAISAALAGVAGGLFAHTNAFVTLDVLSFERSGAVLIMLILGGTGRLYGGLVGAAVYMILEDYASKETPELWFFWIGLLLVLTVLFARDGLLGLIERAYRALRGRA